MVKKLLKHFMKKKKKNQQGFRIEKVIKKIKKKGDKLCVKYVEKLQYFI